jgi:OmpA-OmpF porin, OOP family
MARNCEQCGAPLTHDQAFCTKCGASAREFSASTSTPSRYRNSLLAACILFALAAVVLSAVMLHVAHRAKQQNQASESPSRSDNTAGDLNQIVGAVTGDSGNASSDSSVSSAPPAETNSNSAGANASTNQDGKAASANSPFAPPMPPVPTSSIVSAAATGDQNKDWQLKYERTENGLDADLVVRTGDINNLGFGWPAGFDPFSGQSTPPHSFPWEPRAGAPDGTDRIMIGSALDPLVRYPTRWLNLHDGYSAILENCEVLDPPPGQICKKRAESMPQPIRLAVGTLPPRINAVVVQMFVDDFQAAAFGSHFQVSLNGTRIPSFESALNSLDQTGPIGKLLTLKLLPEYWPLLNSGEVKLLIDDPTTKEGDGYAIDFVRLLVNPHQFKYQVSLIASVVDVDKHTAIAGATVAAALASGRTDQHGKCQLTGLPAGLVTATAVAPGYDENSVPVDLVAGQNGNAEIQLHRHLEDTAALEKELAQTGQATIYGIHFDTDSAKLRADSMPALNAVLGLINNHPGSRWTIGGHTDNQGNGAHNQTLSQNRSASVIAWLKDHGVDSVRLVPQGFGATRPVADNSTENGRALNRRVEIAVTK